MADLSTSSSEVNCGPSIAMEMDVDAGADADIKEHPQGTEAIKTEPETEEQEDDEGMEWSDFAKWTEEEGHIRTKKEEIDLKEEVSEVEDMSPSGKLCDVHLHFCHLARIYRNS